MFKILAGVALVVFLSQPTPGLCGVRTNWTKHCKTILHRCEEAGLAENLAFVQGAPVREKHDEKDGKRLSRMLLGSSSEEGEGEIDFDKIDWAKECQQLLAKCKMAGLVVDVSDEEEKTGR